MDTMNQLLKNLKILPISQFQLKFVILDVKLATEKLKNNVLLVKQLKEESLLKENVFVKELLKKIWMNNVESVTTPVLLALVHYQLIVQEKSAQKIELCKKDNVSPNQGSPIINKKDLLLLVIKNVLSVTEKLLLIVLNAQELEVKQA